MTRRTPSRCMASLARIRPNAGPADPRRHGRSPRRHPPCVAASRHAPLTLHGVAARKRSRFCPLPLEGSVTASDRAGRGAADQPGFGRRGNVPGGRMRESGQPPRQPASHPRLTVHGSMCAASHPGLGRRPEWRARASKWPERGRGRTPGPDEWTSAAPRTTARGGLGPGESGIEFAPVAPLKTRPTPGLRGRATTVSRCQRSPAGAHAVAPSPPTGPTSPRHQRRRPRRPVSRCRGSLREARCRAQPAHRPDHPQHQRRPGPPPASHVARGLRESALSRPARPPARPPRQRQRRPGPPPPSHVAWGHSRTSLSCPARPTGPTDRCHQRRPGPPPPAHVARGGCATSLLCPVRPPA